MANSQLQLHKTHRREPKTYGTHVVRQVLFRAILLIAVGFMAAKIKPRMQDIPYDKLISDYKQPRHKSAFSFWTMAFLIVFEPLSIFILLSRNFRDTIDVILIWSLSISVTAVITEILKLAVGRPRPDFYYRCFPDGMTRTELQCTGKLRDIMDGRKSFPSGHTGISFASLGVVSLFMYRRNIMLYDTQSRASQLLCYSMPLMVASAIGISRWLDNHHHREDVLVGAIIGLTTSCLCYRSDYDWRELGIQQRDLCLTHSHVSPCTNEGNIMCNQ